MNPRYSKPYIITEAMRTTAAQKRVAVIVPCHNHGKYVALAAKSILSGRHKNVDVYCINDGSDEANVALFQESLEAISDHRLKILHTPQKMGRWNTCNHMVASWDVDQYDYFTVLDADDEWLPDRLSISLEAMQATGHEASLTGFHHIFEEVQADALRGTFETPEIGSYEMSIFEPSLTAQWAKDNYLALRGGGGFPCPTFEPHSVSATMPVKWWWQGLRFMPGNVNMRLSPGEDTCLALRIALLKGGIALAAKRPYLYRRNTTTNQKDIVI